MHRSLRPSPPVISRVQADGFPRDRALALRRTVAFALAFLVLPGLATAGVWDGGKARGIVISTHGNGADWGWDTMEGTLDDVRALGAGWVAIHPYAGISVDGALHYRDFDPDRPPAHLARPIREAHRRGLRIMIKPHLAYWGSPFSWRGEIAFEKREHWDRFFHQYETWIVRIARACRDADAFAVGTELDRTVGHDRAWRRIIARVRAETGASLTYGANWTDYERVPFWDALDVIGIQAYFPLTDAAAPDRRTLERAWRARMVELCRFSVANGREIVFTELGYNRSFAAAREPWAHGTDGPEAESFQAECLGVALRAIESEPSVRGAFLWKWFPNPRPVGRNFQLATPLLKRTISEAWRGGRR